MPDFVITGPDGKKYKVTGATAEGALSALRQHFGESATAAPSDTIPEGAGQSVDIGAALPDVAVSRAQRQYNALPEWAKPLVAAQDLLALGANGITYGYGDKGLAALDSLVGRGNYQDRLALHRRETEDARSRAGLAGAVAEIGTSVMPAAKLAQVGVTATRIPGAVGRLGGMAIDGGLFGAVTAAGNDQDIGTGALLGGAFGAGGQAATSLLGTVLKPFAARINPKSATQDVLLRAMDEAGTNPQAIADDLARAAADGQNSYALMDALGYPGQRLASTVARTPSNGRAPMVEFLENRQAGQGRRVSSLLADAFDPETALQKVTKLKEARATTGGINYNAARDAATTVDVSNVLSKIDEMAGNPLAGVDSGIDPDTVGGVLDRVRKMLAGKNGNQLVDFNSVLSVRSDISDMADRAFTSGAKKQGSALKAVLAQLDETLANSSDGYKKALSEYARDSRVIDAVDIGRAAATRGRFEDTIPAFNALIPEAKPAFRAGYVDPLIAQTQSAAVGANKVRPLINDAYAAEFPAFATPGQESLLGRRIARENTMFATRAEALGNSKTANNLADEADLSFIDPSIIGNVLSGNWGGAAKNAMLQGMSALKGQPPAVRKMLSEALRVSDPGTAMQNLNSAVDRINASQQQKQAIVRMLMMLGTAGAAQVQR